MSILEGNREGGTKKTRKEAAMTWKGGIPAFGKQPGDLVRPHALTPLTDCVSFCSE